MIKTLNTILKKPNIGVLVIRIVTGLIMVYYGSQKLMFGKDTWTEVGKAMEYIGIKIFPTFFGLMAGIVEFFGGLLLLLGLFFRTSLSFLIFTMFLATIYSTNKQDDYMLAFTLLFVFVGLFFIGPGKYSIDSKINKNSSL